MKMAGMKKATKKLVFALIGIATACAGLSAMAQGHIVSIKSNQSGEVITASGVDVEMRLILNGHFELISDGGSSTGDPLLRMIVNGTIAWAKLDTISRYTVAAGVPRTDVIFQYTVKPGDMASPLLVFGNSGSISPGDAYQFIWNGWQISEVGTPSNLAIWRYDTGAMSSAYGDVYDPTFTKANIILRTLSFSDATSPTSVAATETVSWRVTSVNPIEGSVVDFYVWPDDPSIVQVGSTPGQALLVSMPSGSTSVDFAVRGLAAGSTDIYLQRTADYLNNGTIGVTNYIKRTIMVTPPPEPTVRVVMVDNGSDNISMDESDVLSTGNFRVELSEAYGSDVYVQIDTAIAGTPQSSLTFAAAPFVVRIPAGDTASPDAKFSVPDGTLLSAATGVTLTPVIQDPTAAGYYTRVREGTVYVANRIPVITRPEPSDIIDVTRGTSSAFEFAVADVPADRSSIVTRWNFGDSTPVQVVTGHVGQVLHTFTSTGTRTVSVQAEDKDGGLSSAVQFQVVVNAPQAQPSVTVTPSSFIYSETTANATGTLRVTLSEEPTEDVWIRLETVPVGQSNIVLSTTDAFRISEGTTNSVSPLRFSLVDGTPISELSGITIRPVVTNAAAAAYFTDLKDTTIFVENIAPVVTRPLATSLSQPADPTYGYDQVPMGQPFTFSYDVFDVPADRASMQVEWNFGDGSSATTVGHNGTVSHIFNSLGDKIVSVQAFDKDGGISTLVEFKVTVVPPPPPPTVRVIPPAFEQLETDSAYVSSILVQLTEAFTTPVVVDLSMSIPNVLSLSQTQVSFPVGETEVEVFISPYDGTLATRAPGVFITPNVVGSSAAVAHYATEQGAYVRIENVAPEISTPAASDINSPNVVFTVPQGAPWRFDWDINDVAADLPTMQVTWRWGDGTETIVTGGSGSINHTYSALGDMIVRVIARDKDGKRSEIAYKIRVLPSKAVNVIPIGPNMESSYYGAPGIGNGTVRSEGARTTENRNNIWYFKYDPGMKAASLEALPYKAQPSYTVTLYNASGVPYNGPTYIYDSFFYVWVGNDQGLPEEHLEPVTTRPLTSVALPDVQGGEESGAVSVEIRNVDAIFSREWRVKDNLGDINLDGIPDRIAHHYGLPEAVAAVAANPGNRPAGLLNAAGYNGDEDYLPAVADGSVNIFATLGAPFTALLEVRGFHEGLNYPNISEPEGPRDEPGADGNVGGTDPTDPDTDGDGFPDGWEYYFWYNAKFYNMTGVAYNPADVAIGITIDEKDIEMAFNPLIPASGEYSDDGVSLRDLDNDGMLDIEELIAGTNPAHWDTDGDGMCDKWEVMRGLDPTDPRDGLNSNYNNPDGDYMAYAVVPRQLITVVANNVTNILLGQGAMLGDTNGTFTTWYHYGNENDPIAVGRPFNFPAGGAVIEIEESEAVLLHFQVRDEFGFDPRTAWTDEIDNGRFAGTGVNGAAPNTKPFTSRDEYLLMKFMSELRLNGVGALIPPKAGDWSAASTDPLTPDTDAGPSGTDGLPDGWELYVATRPEETQFLISPWNYRDGVGDLDPNTPTPGDGLSVRREFAGIYSSAQYASSTLYGSESGYTSVSIVPSAVDQYWVNKFWPTDPWSADTDGDGVKDSAEKAFIYGNPVDSGGLFTAGGGLNPCSVDTDRDALPDGWEVQFAGTPVANDGSTVLEPSLPGQTQSPVAMVITNGMDGTVSDYNEDWDMDGLLNYQEYWVQAVRSFRYDVSLEDAPMDLTHDVSYFFTEVTAPFDLARYPFGMNNPPLWIMLPVYKGNYVSTDPRNADTDNDAMDDYYEMFHGLNPILGMGEQGDRIAVAYENTISAYANSFYVAVNGLPMDFQQYPWLAGLPEADVDSDGLINFEEMLLANVGAAANYNTDPSPLWMTDYVNPNSNTHKYYFNGGMFFWPGTDRVVGDMLFNYKAMFDFEINEGYDTDNDGISDKAELVHSRNPLADPRNHDDPLRRQAIYFSGTNSAARTISSHEHGEWCFRSFTVELWAMPEVVDRAQVILERSVPLAPSDLNDTTPYRDRKTFQIGIEADGRVYAMFENAGSDAHDPQTASVIVHGPPLEANKWVHIATRMNGHTGQFDIIVDGQLYKTVNTQLIPATGVVTVDQSASGETTTYYVYHGVISAGASDITPETSVLYHDWETFTLFYQGYLDEVRIWDGARELHLIDADTAKRYTREDIENNRTTVSMEAYMGASREVGSVNILSPELLYHYTFDNIFGGENPASVAQVPRGFNDAASTTNRPAAADADALLFGLSPVTSTVYLDKQYLPIIENSVDHLPLFGGVRTIDGVTQALISDKVIDSIFWSETQAGPRSGTYLFPNYNNPYGITYNFRQDDPTESTFEFAGDMLPLGDAFAKTVPVMWDGEGPSTPWVETGVDSDSDGLPDWWENAMLGSTEAGWNDLYPDNSGMTNGERYLRDIANGATPDNPTGVGGLVQTADSDGDGLPDWWEDLFSLDKLSAVGVDGAMGDPDRDGLPNFAEYLISDVYQFRYVSPLLFRTDATQAYSDYFQKEGQMTLGAMFTDHDYMEDLWEGLYDPYYVSGFIYDAHEDNDQDGWSNWAEARYSAANKTVRPDSNSSLLPFGDSQAEYPIPFINLTLGYDGAQAGNALVINAYSTPEMDGIPDATFAYGISSDGSVQANQYNLGPWKDQEYRLYLSPGHIDPGSFELEFTDGYTGESRIFGFDQDGVIYGTYSGASSFKIGTVAYATGEVIIDLGKFDKNMVISNDQGQTVLSVATSVVKISYAVNLVAQYPLQLTLSKADIGYVREGLNYFFAFLDLDGNGEWNAGEPCGLPESFGTDIGWDRNAIKIELTDYRAGYLRLDLASGLRSEDVLLGLGGEEGGFGDQEDQGGLTRHVRVLRKYGMRSDLVIDRTLFNRTYLHEGDFLAQGDQAFDWGIGVDVPGVTAAAYEVYVGDHPTTISNTLVASFVLQYDTTQPKALSTKPVHGAYVYSARPTFRWMMSEKYPAFQIEIKKGSSTGATVYQSGPQKAPLRDMATGEYIWEAPIHAGNRLPSGHTFSVNTVYAWRVAPLDAKFTTATAAGWSDWKMFRLDVNAPMLSSGYGMIEVTAKYFGPAVNNLPGLVKIEAYNTRDFTGTAKSQYTLNSTELTTLTDQSTTNVNAVLRGLTPSTFAGDYYVMAYIDSNNNNQRDAWESWGYANYYGKNVPINDQFLNRDSIFADIFAGTVAPYSALPVKVEMSTKIPKVTVVIEDCDTDQDWFPDAWEYEMNPGANFLAQIQPSSTWPVDMGNTEVNPTLTTGTWPVGTISLLMFGSTDSDGDGIDDATEMLVGTDPLTSDSGAVYENLLLGLAPEDQVELFVSGLSFSQSGPEVKWSVDVQKSASNLSDGMLKLLSASGDGTAPYAIQYSESLDNPVWVTVEQGTVTLDGSKTLLDRVKSSYIDSQRGFFRVKIGN